jgi:hypothetical protein
VVVDAEGQRKRTRPLSGVNGEVCKKRKEICKKQGKKALTGPTFLEM